VLDLALRLRVHTLMEWFKTHPVPGVIELSPGVRSLQVNFDSRAIARDRLLEILVQAESELPPVENLTIPTRIVRLPLAWDDIAIRDTIAKYEQSVRPKAPWLPSNIEFIRRMNGLPSVQDVYDTVFNASYLVLGLGDVYLGAPCAVPVDPRHRLVTTKYNPARTWTVENVVGIGGVYMCIYGMEGPGGYQLVGRTVQVWNTYRLTREFQPGHPWLLRFFDQIRFYPVSEKELLDFRKAFLRGGKAGVEITAEPFSFPAHKQFLEQEAGSIAAFRARQARAFSEERERWAADGSANFSTEEAEAPPLADDIALPPGGAIVSSPISGSVWDIPVREGDKVEAGQKIMVLEAMKMEVAVEAPLTGTVQKIVTAKGRLVSAGQPLAVLIP
jgi:urea carboxylase